MKVYVIMTSFANTTWAEACERTAMLDADIQRLAKRVGANVHMHQYAEPSLSAPVILIECPEEFIEKVKLLPLFENVHENEGSPKTIRRRDAIQIEPPEAMEPPKKGPKGPKR